MLKGYIPKKKKKKKSVQTPDYPNYVACVARKHPDSVTEWKLIFLRGHILIVDHTFPVQAGVK